MIKYLLANNVKHLVIRNGDIDKETADYLDNSNILWVNSRKNFKYVCLKNSEYFLHIDLSSDNNYYFYYTMSRPEDCKILSLPDFQKVIGIVTMLPFFFYIKIL